MFLAGLLGVCPSGLPLLSSVSRGSSLLSAANLASLSHQGGGSCGKVNHHKTVVSVHFSHFACFMYLILEPSSDTAKMSQNEWDWIEK